MRTNWRIYVPQERKKYNSNNYASQPFTRDSQLHVTYQQLISVYLGNIRHVVLSIPINTVNDIARK